jgi:hypothetical protein
MPNSFIIIPSDNENHTYPFEDFQQAHHIIMPHDVKTPYWVRRVMYHMPERISCLNVIIEQVIAVKNHDVYARPKRTLYTANVKRNGKLEFLEKDLTNKTSWWGKYLTNPNNMSINPFNKDLHGYLDKKSILYKSDNIWITSHKIYVKIDNVWYQAELIDHKLIPEASIDEIKMFYSFTAMVNA